VPPAGRAIGHEAAVGEQQSEQAAHILSVQIVPYKAFL
jgi:hypothetical protein